MRRLMDILEKYSVGDQELEGEMIWVCDADKGFLVTSMYDTLCPQNPECSPGICGWNPQIQLKMLFFIWRLCWNRAPTIDNLIRREMVITNWCCLCILVGESSGHLFIHCPWVGPLWDYFFFRFGVMWVHPESVNGLL